MKNQRELIQGLNIYIYIYIYVCVCVCVLQSPHYMAYPKSTNQTFPLQPIITSIGSATHKIAQAIAKILTPYSTQSSPYML